MVLKSKNIRGIPKLLMLIMQAHKSLTNVCIILCEGDSAKAGIVSGLSRKDDRNYIGIYPMKGKMLNVTRRNYYKNW